MKKFLTIIGLLFYLVVSSGVIMNFHYCKGKLTGWKVGAQAVCPACGQQHRTSDTSYEGKQQVASKCCLTETRFIKLTTDQKAESSLLADLSPAVLELLPQLWEAFLPPVATSGQQSTYGPDEDSGGGVVPLFIRHCLLLI